MCLPINEWSGLPVNSHHLMREATGRGYQVLYVDPLGLRRPTLARKDVSRLGRRLRQALTPLVAVAPRTWRLAPIGIPLQDTRFGIEANIRLLSPQIRMALRRLKANGILLWIYPPQLIGLRRALVCEFAIYYRTDDYISLGGANRELLTSYEAQAVAEATCHRSCTEIPRRRPARCWSAVSIPNAVDDLMFTEARIGSDPVPHVGRPRLLVIGTFDEWMDLELLRDTMRARPSWELVLAGNPKVAFDELRSLENVHFLGRVPYEELSTLISHCDVGLVPFRVGPIADDDSEQALPVPGRRASRRLHPVPRCRDTRRERGRGADRANLFAAAVERAISTDSTSARTSRQSFARKNTWSARFDTIEAELERLTR